MTENLHPEMKGRKTLIFKGPRMLRRRCQRNFLPGAAIDSDLAELKISYAAADTLAALHGSLPLGAVSIVAVFHSVSVLRSSSA